MYRRVDSYLKRLKRFINRAYNHFKVLAFDQLNAIVVKREVDSLYAELLKFNRLEYREMANYSRNRAIRKLNEDERMRLTEHPFDPDFQVSEVLRAYNPVTMYLYEPEADRKRLRLLEGMLTCVTLLDHKNFLSVINRNANLWYTQSSQYAIDVTDETYLETLREAGIEKVVWVSEKDSKVCRICRERDGQIYDIDEVPDKPHYNCRCHLEPYREFKKIKVREDL